MNFFQALQIADTKSDLIGKEINGERVEDILIIPTNPDDLKLYIDLYIQTQNSQKAIAPFVNGDVKVVALFKKDYLLKVGLFTTIDL